MARAALNGRVDRVQRRMVGRDAEVREFMALPDQVRLDWLMGLETDRDRYPLAWKHHRQMWRELLRHHDE